jgi:ribosome maturation factor RimP
MNMQLHDIQAHISPVITDMGFELVGLEASGHGRHAVLRLFVDKVGGINVDDLTKVTRQVRDVLRVAGYDVDGTSFEVSSPGVNRPLYTLEHYKRFVGCRLKIQMHLPVNGQKSFTGTLTKVSGDTVSIEVDGQEVVLPFGDIAKAKLSPVRP